jgi:hypothetical protein
VQIIRAALRDADRDLLAGLGAAASDIADIVPEIRDLQPGLEPSAPLGDPSEARFRMFESIRQLIASLCRRRTLLIDAALTIGKTASSARISTICGMPAI